MNKLPFVGLEDATTAGEIGPVVDLEGVSCEFTVAVFKSGSPTTTIVALDGSHDGVHWFSLLEVRGSIESTESRFGYNTSSVGPTAQLTPHARYLRTRLALLSGGTNPSITATVAVGKVY